MARSTTAALVAVCILVGLASFASAQMNNYDSTNVTMHGFKIVSNVTGYLRMTLDACEIRDVLKADVPDFARAQFIYLNGSNAIRPDGITRRPLASWTRGGHATGHPYFANGTALFENPDWANATMMEMLAEGEVSAVITLARLQVPLIYTMAELWAIADEIDPNGTNVTATGAPHALDEGFGAYAGSSTECAPWFYAERAAKAFGTRASCGMSKVNEGIVAAFNQAQAATLSGDVASFIQARDMIFRHIQVSLVQNTIMAAKKAEQAWFELRKASSANKAAKRAELRSKHMEAVTIAGALGPYVHAHDAEAAMHIIDLVTSDVHADYSQKIHQALRALYPHMGITADMVGTYGATDNACRKLARKI